MNRVITISREFGSGGRTIGRNAAKKLGISCYDYEIIEKMSQESGFTKQYIEEQGEYALYGSRLSNAFAWGYNSKTPTNQDYIFNIQRKLIIDIAQKEPCVIVGRCADFILKDRADCLNVFIHADMEKRAERIVKLYGESDKEPKKRLADKDKRRSTYYRYYTDQKWGDIRNYHITLDSGVIGIDKCVEIITGLY